MKTRKPPNPRERRKQRGVALIAVMIVLAITLVITNEFGTATNVDLTAAANYRDQMRAHFLARSASSFGELVIRIQQRLDNTRIPGMPGTLGQQVQITDYADQLVVPFCGSAEEVRGAVGAQLASSAKGLGADVGTCGFAGPLVTEDNKLNVNCANANSGWQTLSSALQALVYFPAYDPLFDDNDAEGWHRDRTMQVAAIIDYIDSDTMHVRDRGTSEDYSYENLKDRYYPKDSSVGHHTGNYIDTTDELKLVRGIDDRFWTLFGNAFTAYGGCKLNVAAVTNPQLIAAILFLAAKNPNDPVVLDPRRLFLLASYVAKARQFGEIFMNLDDFIAFVKDPAASVGTLATQTGTMAGSAAGAAMTAGLPGLQSGEKLGLELDKAKLAQIASAGPRRTYKVEAYGEIQRLAQRKDGSPVFPPIRSTVTGIWDTKVVPQNVRTPPVPNGAWVFLKEE
jgi:general secretion pathway protein K